MAFTLTEKARAINTERDAAKAASLAALAPTNGDSSTPSAENTTAESDAISTAPPVESAPAKSVTADSQPAQEDTEDTEAKAKGNVPYERFKARNEAAKAAEARAAALAAEIETLKAAKPAESTETVHAPVAPVLSADEEKEYADLRSKGIDAPSLELARQDVALIHARSQFVDHIAAQVRDEQITFKEGEAEIARVDAIAENARIARNHAFYQQQSRLSTASQRAASVLSKYEHADPVEVSTWVAQGADPEAAAKLSHDRIAPRVTAAATAAADKIRAELTAAHAAELATLTAEHERKLAAAKAKSGAPSTLGGPGRNGTAPAQGTDSPNPTGGFDMRARAEQIRQRTLGYARRD